jgi:hypothetical protein
MLHHKTVTTLGFVIMAGTVFATPAAEPVGAEAQRSTMTRSQGDAAPDSDVVTSLSDKFAELDANNDGLLSQAEAEADPTVGAAYESFDTTNTIEDRARNARPGGITVQQFEAGMQAAATSGAIGPPVSGGETYLVYPDGTMERVKGTSADDRGKLTPNPPRN